MLIWSISLIIQSGIASFTPTHFFSMTMVQSVTLKTNPMPVTSKLYCDLWGCQYTPWLLTCSWMPVCSTHFFSLMRGCQFASAHFLHYERLPVWPSAQFFPHERLPLYLCPLPPPWEVASVPLSTSSSMRRCQCASAHFLPHECQCTSDHFLTHERLPLCLWSLPLPQA